MLENEQQNQEDPKINLLNLDLGIEFIKPIRHKSSYYENDFFVEPWDENQDNFLRLSPKLKEEQQQDRKTRLIKIKLPQSRTQSINLAQIIQSKDINKLFYKIQETLQIIHTFLKQSQKRLFQGY